MKKYTYGYQILILFIWVFVVGGIFSLISNKQMAGVIAGLGFISLASSLLIKQFVSQPNYIFQKISVSIFLVLSAWPIFLLRVFNWGVEFKNLSLFGISSEYLHYSSNFLYFLMSLSTVICYFIDKKYKV